MINLSEFVIRLKQIIKSNGDTAASFAQKVGVQRSSISHIFSGRNKPSLDFVLKIVSAYPEVELDWLLKGVGDFSTSNNELKKIDAITQEHPETPVKKAVEGSNSNDSKRIKQIVIFYNDGSFENFEN